MIEIIVVRQFKKFFCFILALVFILQSVSSGYSQEIFLTPNASNFPRPGAMVGLSQSFNPPVLKGIKGYPDDPFRFDFILDRGDSRLSPDELAAESTRLMKYFLASLTIPGRDLWVNLSPDEKDRIIPDGFGSTLMGRELLAQDYVLKQLTATLLYPEKDLGKRFWDKVYEQVQKRFGTTDIPVDTFHKIWILPDAADIVVKGPAAYIIRAHLKVMLEHDYVALDNAAALPQAVGGAQDDLSGDMMREVIVPAIEKEVNEGRNFASLRQVYYSLILAAWFKKKMKGEGSLSHSYVDQNKTPGVDHQETGAAEKIWARYVESFKKGVFNYISEAPAGAGNDALPRKYFSGGADFAQVESRLHELSGGDLLDAVMGDLVSFRADPIVDRAQNFKPNIFAAGLADRFQAFEKEKKKFTLDELVDPARWGLPELNAFPKGPEGRPRPFTQVEMADVIQNVADRFGLTEDPHLEMAGMQGIGMTIIVDQIAKKFPTAQVVAVARDGLIYNIFDYFRNGPKAGSRLSGIYFGGFGQKYPGRGESPYGEAGVPVYYIQKEAEYLLAEASKANPEDKVPDPDVRRKRITDQFIKGFNQWLDSHPEKTGMLREESSLEWQEALDGILNAQIRRLAIDVTRPLVLFETRGRGVTMLVIAARIKKMYPDLDITVALVNSFRPHGQIAIGAIPEIVDEVSMAWELDYPFIFAGLDQATRLPVFRFSFSSKEERVDLVEWLSALFLMYNRSVIGQNELIAQRFQGKGMDAFRDWGFVESLTFPEEGKIPPKPVQPRVVPQETLATLGAYQGFSSVAVDDPEARQWKADLKAMPLVQTEIYSFLRREQGNFFDGEHSADSKLLTGIPASRQRGLIKYLVTENFINNYIVLDFKALVEDNSRTYDEKARVLTEMAEKGVWLFIYNYPYRNAQGKLVFDDGNLMNYFRAAHFKARFRSPNDLFKLLVIGEENPHGKMGVREHSVRPAEKNISWSEGAWHNFGPDKHIQSVSAASFARAELPDPEGIFRVLRDTVINKGRGWGEGPVISVVSPADEEGFVAKSHVSVPEVLKTLFPGLTDDQQRRVESVFSSVDSALSDRAEALSPGGIDLNDGRLQMNTRSEGGDLPKAFPDKGVAEGVLLGLSPVVLGIKPAVNVREFLGLIR